MAAKKKTRNRQCETTRRILFPVMPVALGDVAVSFCPGVRFWPFDWLPHALTCIPTCGKMLHRSGEIPEATLVFAGPNLGFNPFARGGRLAACERRDGFVIE